jgi:DNA anti-recombination protein RmuC
MDRIIYAGGEPDSAARERLQAMIAETQELLKEQVKAIHAAFDDAMKTYREIDELLAEKKSGQKAA